MKRTILMLSVIGLLLSSCEKDEELVEDQNSSDSTLVDSTETDTTINTSDTTNNTDALIIDSDGNIYDTVTNPVTGRTWLDRNLGASQVATSSTDTAAYGHYYQWGRGADGHQYVNSDTTSISSSSDQPGHGDFITSSVSPYDWRSPKNDSLWQGVNGVNNPCPNGYRLPTDSEWQEEMDSWDSDDAAGAFGSPLRLTMAGGRYLIDGSLVYLGTDGSYWGSTVDRAKLSVDLFFTSTMAHVGEGTNRAHGSSVRCIMD